MSDNLRVCHIEMCVSFLKTHILCRVFGINVVFCPWSKGGSGDSNLVIWNWKKGNFNQ